MANHSGDAQFEPKFRPLKCVTSLEWVVVTIASSVEREAIGQKNALRKGPLEEMGRIGRVLW